MATVNKKQELVKIYLKRARSCKNQPAIAYENYSKAAELGSMEAYYQMGEYLVNGWAGRKSNSAAMKHFKIAADSGHVMASESLAMLLLGVAKKKVKKINNNSLMVNDDCVDDCESHATWLIKAEADGDFANAFLYLQVAKNNGGKLAGWYFADGRGGNWQRIINLIDAKSNSLREVA